LERGRPARSDARPRPSGNRWETTPHLRLRRARPGVGRLGGASLSPSPERWALSGQEGRAIRRHARPLRITARWTAPLLAAAALTLAAAPPAAGPTLPPRAIGDGPYSTLILRGAFLVDGTGAALRGPVDIVVRGNRIDRIVQVGKPGVEPNPARRPAGDPGGRELDLAGKYVLPGLIDLYGYLPEPADYVTALWLAHGVTTVREPVCERGAEGCVALAAASAANRVAAPRIVPFLHFGLGHGDHLDSFLTPEEARQWVAGAAKTGVAGIKFRGERPDVLAAAVAEARARGLLTATHLAAAYVARVDAAAAAEMGIGILEHYYGLPEALLTDRTVADLPPDFNDSDEQQRFAAAGRLWRQAAAPGSERWNQVLATLRAHDVTLVPTLSLYDANRDLMRARTAEWLPLYALPEVWDAFTPDRRRHASHFYAWTSEHEAAWRENLRPWMAFLAGYKNRGGRVAVGSDAGFMYSLYGFGTVREMELLREATLAGAEALGRAADLGSVEAGKLADLLVVDENPLADLKVLYGTGALRLGDDGRLRRVGGVRATIKDGIVYDAAALRAELRQRVAAAWAKAPRPFAQPGIDQGEESTPPVHP